MFYVQLGGRASRMIDLALLKLVILFMESKVLTRPTGFARVKVPNLYTLNYVSAFTMMVPSRAPYLMRTDTGSSLRCLLHMPDPLLPSHLRSEKPR